MLIARDWHTERRSSTIISSADKYVDRRGRLQYVSHMELQTLILELGLKQNWVARQIGIDKATFSRIVHGRSALDARKIETLASVLRVPISRVLAALKEDDRASRPMT